MAKPFTPRLVTDPVNGHQWMARSRLGALRRWWTLVLVLLAFGLGWFGRGVAFWTGLI